MATGKNMSRPILYWIALATIVASLALGAASTAQAEDRSFCYLPSGELDMRYNGMTSNLDEAMADAAETENVYLWMKVSRAVNIETCQRLINEKSQEDLTRARHQECRSLQDEQRGHQSQRAKYYRTCTYKDGTVIKINPKSKMWALIAKEKKESDALKAEQENTIMMGGES